MVDRGRGTRRLAPRCGASAARPAVEGWVRLRKLRQAHPLFLKTAARFLVAVLMLLVGGSAAIVVSLLPGERVWLWLLCQTIRYGFEGLAARSHLDDSTAD